MNKAVGFLIALLVLFLSGFTCAASTYWDVSGTGMWMLETNWRYDQLPRLDETVHVNKGNPVISTTSQNALAGNLYISGATVDMEWGELRVNDHMAVGYWSGSGPAAFYHENGKVSAYILRLCAGSNTQAVYEITDGELDVNDMDIGTNGGSGAFIQTGGTVNVENVISLPTWYASGAGISYEMSGGRLNTRHLYIEQSDNDCQGTFNIVDNGAEILIKNSLTIKEGGRLLAVPDAVIHFSEVGFFNPHTTDFSKITDLENLSLLFDGVAPDFSGRVYAGMEVAGKDLGAVAAGFDNNFAPKAVALGQNSHIYLSDAYDNQPGSTGPEALYVRDLTLSKNAVLHLNGFNVYCNCFLNLDGIVDDSGGGTLTSLHECHRFEVSADPEKISNDGISASALTITLIIDYTPMAGEEILVTTDKGWLTDGTATGSSITAVTNAFGEIELDLLADEEEGLATIQAQWTAKGWTTSGTVEIVEPGIEISAEESRYMSVPDGYGADPKIRSFSSPDMPEITAYGTTEIPMTLTLISPDPGLQTIELTSASKDKLSAYGIIEFPSHVMTDDNGVADFTLKVSDLYEHNLNTPAVADWITQVELTAAFAPPAGGETLTCDIVFPLVNNYNLIRDHYYQDVPKGPLTDDGFRSSYLDLVSKALWANPYSRGSVNNLKSWKDPQFNDFTCGAYQMQVLFLLDTIRFDSDQSWILNGFDFGPIKQLNGAHQAAMIWPGKYSWQDWDQTMILDPWITQDPNNSDYTGNAWLSLIGAALPVGGVILDLFTSGGSSNFNIDKYYPSTGNPYPPGPQWLTAGSAPFSLGVVLDCPVDILITDNAGNRTGNLPDPGQDEAPFFSEIPGLNQYPALLPDGTRSWFLEIPDTDVHLEITGYDKGEFTLYVTNAGSGNLEPFSRIPILTDQKASLTLDPTALKIPAVTFEDGSLVLPDTILDLAQTGYDGTAGETLVEVSLTNISGVPVHGPLHLVLTHMDPGSMSLVSPDGTTPSGSPYVDLTGLLAENRLDPDEEITKEIRFNCPGNIKFKICVELQGLTGTGKTVTARLNDFMIGHQGAWPMKQRTMHQTGRAQFTVPSHRMNDTFFDVISWQTPIPGNPDNENDGRFGGTSMTFFDGAGPDGTDIVLGTYHWPKGIQGMNRHTGEVLWNGNPDNGGEEIAKMTPAFSNDGSSVYLTNQYTASGGSLLAFDTADGPSMVRHNALDITPENLKYGSPVIGPQGRIYVHGWWDRPRAGTDNGTSIAETWQAKNPLGMLKNDAALFQDGAILKVISGGRDMNIKCFDGHTGDELWSISLGKVVDASVTIDPSNGNIYVGAGDNDIYVVGVDKNGNPLPGWPSTFVQVHDWIDGTNNPQRSQAAGCLSHDGSTYYFQTTSEQGDGKLYAVNTMDGSVKWSFDTQAKGPEVWSSASPIVTKNNVIIIGNHDGDTYFAIHDQGNAGVLLDTFQMDASGDVCAKASPTLSSEGQLYLPLRTKWTAGNASQTPDLTVRHLFCSFDLEARFPIPDLADFAADFGKTDSPGSPGDLDRDTDVDGQDLIRFILNYAP